jgi:hypothetical protein
MERKAFAYILEWFFSSDRKPLIIRGARQVGKTWLVRDFANRDQLITLIEINFEKQPNLKKLFETNDPKQIIYNLELHFNQSIDIKNTLLFLDEVQEFPELLSKLRWFAEDLPELAVVAAGSLLDFTLAMHEYSMPVGRVGYLYLEPLSFEEFLLALGKEKLYHFLFRFTLGETIAEPIHQQFSELIKEYIIVGGLPAAVSSWATDRSMEQVSQIHHNLLATYRDDFAKYARKLPIARLDEVLLNVPKMLGNKFVYKHVNAEVQSPAIKQALHLLTEARLCHVVRNSSGNGVPLGAEVHDKSFKVIFIDIGLVSASLGLKLKLLSTAQTITLINQGGISEQFTGQILRTITPFYIAPALYYWLRQEKGSAAEIDYLFQYANHVIPIEVKSGSTGSLKSLHLFMSLKKLKLAVRINGDLPSLTTVNAKTHTGETVEYQLLSLPFYLLGQLEQMLLHVLEV